MCKVIRGFKGFNGMALCKAIRGFKGFNEPLFWKAFTGGGFFAGRMPAVLEGFNVRAVLRLDVF